MPLVAGEYMLDALFRAGPLGQPTINGRAALSWSEIVAFAAGTHRISEPSEIEDLFDMSRAYLDGLTQGEDPLGAPPYEKP